jgi:hypothetical protein
LSKVTTTTAAHTSKNTQDSSTKDMVTPGKDKTMKGNVKKLNKQKGCMW